MARPAHERVLSRVTPGEGGCWLFTGYVGADGYGKVKHGGNMTVTHRVVYEALAGPIPDGLVIDHLCRVKRCVNPDHLEAVPQRTNFLRGVHRSAVAYLTDTCKRGHSLLEAHQYETGRVCQRCQNEVRRERRKRDVA